MGMVSAMNQISGRSINHPSAMLAVLLMFIISCETSISFHFILLINIIILSISTQFVGLVGQIMVGDLLTKAFLEIHMEVVHSLIIYMIEICIHHHPLLALCGLSLEEIMMRNMPLPEITDGMTMIIEELIDSMIIIMLLTATMNLAVTVILVLIGAKGLEVETVRSFMVGLTTAIAVALTKAERTAMREIINMDIPAMIQIMREARAGEGVIHVRVNMAEEG
jgi:hypothetical protein